MAQFCAKKEVRKILKSKYFISLIQIKDFKGEYKLSGIVSGGMGKCGTGQISLFSVRVFPTF